MRHPTLVASAALLVATSCPLRAQQFFTPGAEVDGQVSVQVNATLDDGIGEYAPIAYLALILYRGATDSMALRTDDAGVLRFAIAPGTYRLSTPEPARWHGRSYRWNVPVEVKRGMRIVNLTVANAVVAGGSTPGVARASSAGPAPAERQAAVPVAPYAQKDGAVGVLFGFLLTGGGQFYAGSNTKGAVLLGLSLVEVVTAVSMVGNCDPYCTDSQITTAQVLLLPAVFNWVYGMATAPGDVRRWNEEHQRVARMRPVVQQVAGRTGVGVGLGF